MVWYPTTNNRLMTSIRRTRNSPFNAPILLRSGTGKCSPQETTLDCTNATPYLLLLYYFINRHILPHFTCRFGCFHAASDIMKSYCLTLFAIFVASVFQSTAARGSSTSQGFQLNERARKTSKLSDIDQQGLSVEDNNLRQWNAEEYDAIMSNLSGQGNLRHRQMQQSGDFTYSYVGQDKGVTKWQIAALVFVVTATVGLACYAYALRHELSHLNQYLPLGYTLFPESGTTDDDAARVDGVELS